MRPINIKISAFGPYKDSVFVDFTKFYDGGIFLITGDTGSGKTTIFDAICYALFGNASGINRDKSSFRSDFASDDTRTYVIFEFSHKGCVYKIERSPSYSRKKKRGVGSTLVSGDATLIYLDKVITGEKNVTDKCVEILGINYSQFKQVSMIAQGEFLKLLLAKSDERADIFRRVFDTGIYKEISERLKKQYLEIKRNYEDELLNLSNLKNGVICEVARDLDVGIGEFLEMLMQEITLLKNKEDKLNISKDNLLNKIQNIISKIDNGSEINSNFEKYETLVREKKLKESNSIDDKKELVRKNKDIYDFIVPLYEELLRYNNMIDEKKDELLVNNKKIDSVSREYNKILVEYNKRDYFNDKLGKLRVKLSELEGRLPLFLEVDELESQLGELENIYNLLKVNELNLLVSKFENNKKIAIKYKKVSNDFLLLKERYNVLSSNYNSMYNEFIRCQAGILASELNDGEACPVCGSLQHPMKANVSLDIVSKRELDLSKERVDNCQKELDILSSEVSSLGVELEISNKDVECLNLDVIKKDIAKYKENVISKVDVSGYSIGDIEIKIGYIKVSIDDKKNLINGESSREELESKINNIRKEIVELEDWFLEVSKKYEDITNEKVKLEAFVKVLNKDILELEKKVVDFNEKYVSKYVEFGYDSEDEYLAVKLDRDVYLRYLKECDNYDKELLKLDSKIMAIIELIDGKEKIDIDELVVKKEKMSVSLAQLEAQLRDVHSVINNNELIYKKIKNSKKRISKVEKELELYEDLSNTANGNIKGKNKVEFEQFVQAYYFDSVLESANKRFSYMTDSRYLLVRKVTSSKISDKLGLELEVFDNYTGKIRGITSLSGGESFKAALSLSLGISDVVQSYAGGIVIDTMFIDEGFGSLDSESLEQAVNAISMLNNGNRLIGIISHVFELKDRIDKKIVIKKGINGSSIDVVI